MTRNIDPKPIHQIVRGGEDWWFCPICEAGWQQYSNIVAGRAKEQAQDCIGRHCCKTDGKTASHMIIGVVHNPEQNAQIKREITKVFNINKGRLL